MKRRKLRKDSPWSQSAGTESQLQLYDQLLNGRALAWYALQQYDESGKYLTDILREADRLHSLSTQERAQAVDIAAGTMRRRRTIDTLLDSQISRSRANVEPDLWRLLQLGVCQVAFSRTPEHAAVSSTVELARSVGCARWSGFVNGVLRNVLRLMTEDTVDRPASDVLPATDGTLIRLQQSILPDPSQNMAAWFGRAFSFPRSLSRRWTARFAESDLLTMGFQSLAAPVTSLRVNRLRASTADVQAALEGGGMEVHRGSHPWSLRIASASRLTQLPGYAEGHWLVQDVAATMATEMLEPEPGQRILDLCSAPGGKSTHLAELMRDSGEVVACDVSAQRLDRVAENAARLGLHIVRPVLIGRNGEDIPDEPFDAALVDVPCTNTGVLARRPEARWRFNSENLKVFVQMQTRLLLTAAERVRSGGKILYSTCSIEPEETVNIVKSVSEGMAELSVLATRQLLPGQPGDGAFQALLQRK